MIVPEKLANFRVYEDGNNLVGIADVTLPSFDAMTETVKGAGIAGEIDSPTIGHFGSMELGLNWRTINQHNVLLTGADGLKLDLRGAIQVRDTSTGKLVIKPVKIMVNGVSKKTELGKFEVASPNDTANTIEVDYIKIDIDGKTQLELDKYNFIFKVGDNDLLKDMRSALGME